MKNSHTTILQLLLSTALLLIIPFSGCKPSTNKSDNSDERSTIVEEARLTIKHATLFTVENIPAGHRVVVLSPANDTDTLQRLVLLPAEEAKIYEANKGETVITVPCAKMALLSDTFVGAIEMLDARNLLVGTSDTATLFDEALREKAQRGMLHSLQKSGTTDTERLIALAPNIAMVNYFNGVETTLPLPKDSPVILVYNNDWLESSLLARAEWIKFIALFTGKAATANKLFDAIERRYEALKAKAATAKQKPSVFFGNAHIGSWYLPSSDSYVAKMISDAGGDYKAPSDAVTQTGISFEVVLRDHQNDDIWLAWQMGNVASLEEFGKLEEHNKLFKAFKDGRVYLNDAKHKGNGNDYFEQGPYRPDEILADLIAIFHPALVEKDYKFTYWRKLP